MIFGIRADKDEAVLNYYIETNKRLSAVDPVKNPFLNSKIGFILRENKVYLVCDLKPLWPNFAPFIMLSGLFSFLLGFHKTAFILESFGLILYLFFSRYFFFLILWLGLRKKGFKGSARIVSDQELLKVVTYG